ncbi:MAG: transporter substrate-binding domain-containing protein [Lachnospiraceae bacterium]|nr:transporter substrate-binding domain-containing protein [Lachnospiraceae bacterium]
MRKRLLLSGIILGLILMILIPQNALAREEQNKNGIETVRVGIFSLGSFQGWDEQGDVCGYNIDYLNEIAKKTHWQYEYVKCDNWVDATEKLEAGEIDLLAPAQITKDLSARFGYAAVTMGTESAAIYTKVDRDDLLYEDFDTMGAITFGCAENSTFARKFVEEYTVNAGFTPKIEYYANTTELRKALDAGEVDAIVTNIMFASDDLKILGWFSPLPVYYISQKDNNKLLDAISDAMLEITVETPDFQSNLLSSYFPIYDSTHISYEEMNYLSGLSELNVGYLTGERPIAYTDESTGEYNGITRGIFDAVAEKLDLQIHYIPLAQTDMSPDKLAEKNISVIANYE